MSKLTVTIITLNEEEYLPHALSSIKGLADEVVVVDSGSTDKTIEIAKKFGAKIFTKKFENYADQKNFAVSKTSNDWILSLDADEEVSTELAREIKEILKDPSFDAYSMPRKNILLGKFIRYTRWQPELDRHIWMWKKDKGKWVGKLHEELAVGEWVGKLEHPKIHTHYKTINEFLEMVNKYSDLDAGERVEKGTKFSLIRMIWDPFYNFAVRYVYRLGFLDGWRGFVLSFLMAVYHFVLWVKIWEKKS